MNELEQSLLSMSIDQNNDNNTEDSDNDIIEPIETMLTSNKNADNNDTDVNTITIETILNNNAANENILPQIQQYCQYNNDAELAQNLTKVEKILPDGFRITRLGYQQMFNIINANDDSWKIGHCKCPDSFLSHLAKQDIFKCCTCQEYKCKYDAGFNFSNALLQSRKLNCTMCSSDRSDLFNPNGIAMADIITNSLTVDDVQLHAQKRRAEINAALKAAQSQQMTENLQNIEPSPGVTQYFKFNDIQYENFDCRNTQSQFIYVPYAGVLNFWKMCNFRKFFRTKSKINKKRIQANGGIYKEHGLYHMYYEIRKQDTAGIILKPHFVPKMHGDTTKFFSKKTTVNYGVTVPIFCYREECGLINKQDGRITVVLPKNTKKIQKKHIKCLIVATLKECRRIADIPQSQHADNECVQFQLIYSHDGSTYPYTFESECNHDKYTNQFWDPTNESNEKLLAKTSTFVLNEMIQKVPKPWRLCGNYIGLATISQLHDRRSRLQLKKRGRTNIKRTNMKKKIESADHKLQQKSRKYYSNIKKELLQHKYATMINPIKYHNAASPFSMTICASQGIDQMVKQGGINDGIIRSIFIDEAKSIIRSDHSSYYGRTIPSAELTEYDKFHEFSVCFLTSQIGSNTGNGAGGGNNLIATNINDQSNKECTGDLIHTFAQKLSRGYFWSNILIKDMVTEFVSDWSELLIQPIVQRCFGCNTVLMYCDERYSEIYNAVKRSKMRTPFYRTCYGHAVPAIERRTNDNLPSGMKKQIRQTILSMQYTLYTKMYGELKYGEDVYILGMYYTSIMNSVEYLLWETNIPDDGEPHEFINRHQDAANYGRYYDLFRIKTNPTMQKQYNLYSKSSKSRTTSINNDKKNQINKYEFLEGKEDESNIHRIPIDETDDITISHECCQCRQIFQQTISTSMQSTAIPIECPYTNCQKKQLIMITSCNQITNISFGFIYKSNDVTVRKIATTITNRRYTYTDVSTAKTMKINKITHTYTLKMLQTQCIVLQNNCRIDSQSPNPWQQRILWASDLNHFRKTSVFFKGLQPVITYNDTQATVEITIDETRQRIKQYVQKIRKQPIDTMMDQFYDMETEHSDRNNTAARRNRTNANRSKSKKSNPSMQQNSIQISIAEEKTPEILESSYYESSNESSISNQSIEQNNSIQLSIASNTDLAGGCSKHNRHPANAPMQEAMDWFKRIGDNGWSDEKIFESLRNCYPQQIQQNKTCTLSAFRRMKHGLPLQQKIRTVFHECLNNMYTILKVNSEYKRNEILCKPQIANKKRKKKKKRKRDRRKNKCKNKNNKK